MSTRETDHGARHILREIARLVRDKPTVQVGIFDNDRIATAALANEYGTGHIPARPAFRDAFDRVERDLDELVLEDVIDHNRPASAGLERAARVLHKAVLAEFDRGQWAPNAPSTVARKGFNRPLFASGETRRAIGRRVVKRDDSD